MSSLKAINKTEYFVVNTLYYTQSISFDLRRKNCIITTYNDFTYVLLTLLMLTCRWPS